MSQSTKINLSGVKRFIAANRVRMFICKSRFVSSMDHFSTEDGGFQPVRSDSRVDNTMGINGANFDPKNKNVYSAYEKEGAIGVEVNGKNGRFILAVKLY